MKNELEAREDWHIIEDDMMGTLKAIKEITHNHQTSKYCIGTVSKAMKDFFTVTQEDNELTVQFAKQCRTCKELMEDWFGKLDMEQAIKSTLEHLKLCDNKGNWKSTNKTEAEKLFESSHQRLTGHNYLQASSLDKAKQLCKELSNKCALGDDKYPKDLDHVIDMLNRHRAPIPFDKTKNKNNKNNDNDTQQNRVAFTQATPEFDRKTFDNITCNKCKKKGHYTNQCPDLHNTSNVNATDDNNDNNNQEPPPEDKTSQTGSTQQGTGHLQMSRWNPFNGAIIKASNFLNFSQLMHDLLLLDNQSTDDIFCNNKYLINIHCVDESLQLSTNGGILTANMKWTFPGYGLVWYHPKAIANVSSQSRVEDQGYTISCQCGSYKVTGPKSHAFFKRTPEGLHALRLDHPKNQLTNNNE